MQKPQPWSETPKTTHCFHPLSHVLISNHWTRQGNEQFCYWCLLLCHEVLQIQHNQRREMHPTTYLGKYLHFLWQARNSSLLVSNYGGRHSHNLIWISKTWWAQWHHHSVQDQQLHPMPCPSMGYHNHSIHNYPQQLTRLLSTHSSQSRGSWCRLPATPFSWNFEQPRQWSGNLNLVFCQHNVYTLDSMVEQPWPCIWLGSQSLLLCSSVAGAAMHSYII